MKILGVLVLIAGLAGLGFAFERHQAASETAAQMESHLKKAEESRKAGDEEDARQRTDYIRMDTEMFAKQQGSRNLYGGIGLAGVALGVILIVVGRKKAATRS
jgi:Flp pilus assembly protein TadB